MAIDQLADIDVRLLVSACRAQRTLDPMDRRVCGLITGEWLFAGRNRTRSSGLNRNSLLHDSFDVTRPMPILLSGHQIS
jgi:hypothetical protein